MWWTSNRFLFALVVGSFSFSPSSFAVQSENSSARELFGAALAADAAGDPELHQRLIESASEVDPDFELARWHQGQVFFRGYWRTLENVGRIVSHDPRWKEYRELLEEADGTTGAHVRLAKWCHREGLQNEEEWHWQQVLTQVPEHSMALEALGKKPYQGGYYTPQEIVALKKAEDRAQRDFKSYRRQFRRLISEAYRGDEYAREKSLAEIAAINDPAAVEALFDALVNVSRQNKTHPDSAEPKFDVLVGRAIVAALANIEEHRATLRLLDIAVFATQPELRRYSAETLRDREPTSYVPLLMAQLSKPLETSFSVEVMPDGKVNLVEDIYNEGPQSASRKVRDASYATFRNERVRVEGSREPQVILVPDRDADLAKVDRRISRMRSLVAIENFSRAQRNAQIGQVLEIITGQNLGNDAQAWWDAWKQYNEIYTPEEIPVEEQFSQEYVYDLPPPPPPPGSHECFVAGTPVWTQAGPVAIEKVEVGDLVLSQDPETGELDYCPVTTTTVRPPTRMTKLSIGSESVISTLGHRYWVPGEGWQMAKFLQAGSSLFSVRGTLGVEAAEEVQEAAAHNLVVDRYHTFFVGQSRLLVHDSTCPKPTTATLPGVFVEQSRRLAHR